MEIIWSLVLILSSSLFYCLEAFHRFSRFCDNHVLGLPNTFGDYDETPEITGELLKVKTTHCVHQ